MSIESVKKIDKHFLDTGTREQLREAVTQCLDVLGEQVLENRRLRGRLLAMENQLRELLGEKKSPNSGCLILRNPGAA